MNITKVFRLYLLESTRKITKILLSFFGRPTQNITLWPPFSDNNHHAYKKLCEEFDHYCKNTNLILKSYWHVDGGQLTAKYYTFEKQAFKEDLIEKVNIGSLPPTMRTTISIRPIMFRSNISSPRPWWMLVSPRLMNLPRPSRKDCSL